MRSFHRFWRLAGIAAVLAVAGCGDVTLPPGSGPGTAGDSVAEIAGDDAQAEGAGPTDASPSDLAGPEVAPDASMDAAVPPDSDAGVGSSDAAVGTDAVTSADADALPGDAPSPDVPPSDVPSPDAPPTDAPSPDVTPVDTASDTSQPVLCGGIAGFGCQKGAICDVQGCYPDAAGTCVAEPMGCPDLWAPVCGCNGKTYGSDCDRLMAGVAKNHDGACVNSGACLIGGLDAVCLKGEFCKGPEGMCSGQGSCKPMPAMCAGVVLPVCGCDGKTYGNACEAEAVGIVVASQGACSSGGKACGGFAGFQCGNDVCDLNGCFPDAAGTCVPKPNGCPKFYAPVCGCDNKTYGNDCERLVAGVALKAKGPCLPPNGPCIDGDPTPMCAAGSYCKALMPGQCGGPGLCTPQPDGCAADYAPVCGCDGKTYSNACGAAAFGGVNVASTGECAGGGGCVTAATCPQGQGCKDGQCQTCKDVMCPMVLCGAGQKQDPCTCKCYYLPD